MSDHQNQKINQLISEAIRSIQYGSVEITIHASKVVQIERNEKIRIINSD